MEHENIAVWPGWKTVRLIGRGSFGAVYEIERDVLGEKERAALKVISIPRNTSDIDELIGEGYNEKSITSTFDSYLKNIVAEYSRMRKMNGSANVVSCDDVSYIQHDDGIGWDIFIRMELLTPMAQALGPEVSDEQVIRIGMDICKALSLCRKHNIIHRDVKPANIFVSDNGDYKLGDFGISKTVEMTAGGTKIGTYDYMAPEVYHDRPYGSAADIYSLGMVLYWLLNERRTPFLQLPPALPTNADKEQARRRRFRGDAIPAPAHGGETLKGIVLKAVAFAPEDRYQSADDMLQDLEALNAAKWAGYAPAPQIREPEPEPEQSEDLGDEPTIGSLRSRMSWAPAKPEPQAEPVQAGMGAGNWRRPEEDGGTVDHIVHVSRDERSAAASDQFAPGRPGDEENTLPIRGRQTAPAGQGAAAPSVSPAAGEAKKQPPAAAKAQAETGKKKSSAGKWILIAAASVVVVAALVIGLVVVPRSNENKRLAQAYKEAEALLYAKDYDRAAAAFEALGDYRNSKSMAEEALQEKTAAKRKADYQAALALEEAGQFLPAYSAYLALGDYMDSAERADTVLAVNTERELLRQASVGDTVRLGVYEQDNDPANGAEPIEWTVLAKEGDRVLLVSKFALDSQKYNIKQAEISWESSTMRKWLNESFFPAAFNSAEQSMIPQVTVPAEGNQDFGTAPGNDTVDRVFLLSASEAEQLFASDQARRCSPTAYAIAQGCELDPELQTCWWWLRTPGSSADRALGVRTSGSFLFQGKKEYYGASVNAKGNAVRPALWVELGD